MHGFAIPRPGIQFFAAKFLQRGDHVRTYALWGWGADRAGVIAAVDGAVIVFGDAGGGVGHHFNAAGDAKIVHAAHDVSAARFTDVIPEPQKRSSVTADAEVSQPASKQPYDQRRILLADLRTATHDHVVDVCRIQVVALADASNTFASRRRVKFRQRALARFANTSWGSSGVNDVCLGHNILRFGNRVALAAFKFCFAFLHERRHAFFKVIGLKQR